MNLADAICADEYAEARVLPSMHRPGGPEPTTRIHYRTTEYSDDDYFGGINRVTGEDHHRAKFTDAQVEAIRAMYQPGVVGYETIAAKFGCGASTVRDIVKGKTRNPQTKIFAFGPVGNPHNKNPLQLPRALP